MIYEATINILFRIPLLLFEAGTKKKDWNCFHDQNMSIYINQNIVFTLARLKVQLEFILEGVRITFSVVEK